MPPITRLNFVKTCAALAATTATPDIHFPTAPRDRLCVASYPFRNSMERRGHAGLALKDFAAMVADKFDVHNIEPLSSHFPSTEPAYLAELRAAVERAHSHIVDIAAEARASMYSP